MNYESIDYQPIRDDDYIEDTMTQYYGEFNEERWGESRFWDHSFPQAEFAYNMAHDSTRFPRTQKRIDFVEKSNKYKATVDKRKWEKLFEKKDMMVYLHGEIIPAERVPTK